MVETGENKLLLRGKAVGVHLGVICLSFVISFMLLPLIIPFDIEGTGITAAVYMVLFGHAVALVVGLFFSRASVKSCAIVFGVAFLFTAWMSVDAIQEWRYLRYQAVYDRFQDTLASPVPKSVSNLRFVSLEEGIVTDLMFEFDIDPADMDAILARLKLERVDHKNMLNPKDFFQHAYYMPVDGDYQVFQGKDKFDEVLTIKTNGSHTHSVFRKESSGKYRDREWENGNPAIIRMDNDALERLRRKYSK